MKRSRYPSQGQLMLPLLDVLDQAREATPRDVYRAVADTVDLPPEMREAITAQGVRVWDRHVRWTEQGTRRKGLTETSRRNLWRATQHGHEFLRLAEPGTVTVVLRRPNGEALWADSLEVLRGLEPSSVDLFFTSPPYMLARPKEYGGFSSEQEYIDWFLPFAQEMHRTLRDSGSFVLNLGLSPYLPGVPVRGAYTHRLILALLDQIGLHFAGEHVWVNPAALPAPAPWVTRQRRQVKDGYKLVIWFSRSQWPKADNRRVLTPYSEGQLKAMERGAAPAIRPSGHRLTGDFAKDNGGAIPSRVLVAANTEQRRVPAALPRGWPTGASRPVPRGPARVVDPLPDDGGRSGGGPVLRVADNRRDGRPPRPAVACDRAVEGLPGRRHDAVRGGSGMRVVQVRIKPEDGVTLAMEGDEAVLTAEIDKDKTDYPYLSILRVNGHV